MSYEMGQEQIVKNLADLVLRAEYWGNVARAMRLGFLYRREYSIKYSHLYQHAQDEAYHYAAECLALRLMLLGYSWLDAMEIAWS